MADGSSESHVVSDLTPSQEGFEKINSEEIVPDVAKVFTHSDSSTTHIICVASPSSSSSRSSSILSLRAENFPLPESPVPQTMPVDMSIHYGLHSVQGHRPEMEDDHKCIHRGTTEPVTPSSPVKKQSSSEGQGDEEEEDFVSPPDVSFFGVYDGHAGTAAATFLRKHLHRKVLGHPKLAEDPEFALKDGIASVEESFVQYAEEQRLDAGSTLAVVLIIGNHLIIANVGDSEVVLSRGGSPVILTTIHNMRKNSQEEERVKEIGGRIHHKRLGHPRYNPSFFSIAVTRSIGDVFFKSSKFTEGKSSGLIAEADTQTHLLMESDRFVIIGCDGLWDVMSYQQAIDFVENHLNIGTPVQKVSEELVQEALKLGSTDNITALVITIDPPRLATPPMFYSSSFSSLSAPASASAAISATSSDVSAFFSSSASVAAVSSPVASFSSASDSST